MCRFVEPLKLFIDWLFAKTHHYMGNWGGDTEKSLSFWSFGIALGHMQQHRPKMKDTLTTHKGAKSSRDGGKVQGTKKQLRKSQAYPESFGAHFAKRIMFGRLYFSVPRGKSAPRSHDHCRRSSWSY